MALPKIFRYSLNKKIRGIVKWIMFLDATKTQEKRPDFHKEQVERILLVRPSSRMGHLILATPGYILVPQKFSQCQD